MDAATSALEKKFSFTLPDGDAGIVRKTRIQRFQADRSSYTSGDTITFRLQSQGMAIDPKKSFIRMRVKASNAGMTAVSTAANLLANQRTRALIASAGIAGAIKKIRTISYNGVVMEEIEHYNTLSALHDTFLVSQEAKENELASEGWFPRARMEEIEALRLDWISAASQTTAANVIAAPAISLHDAVTYSNWSGAQRRQARHTESWYTPFLTNLHGHSGGRDVAFRLRQSGIWGGDRIIPLQHLGQLTLEMLLEHPDRVFQQMQWTETRSDVSQAAAVGTITPFTQRLVPIGALESENPPSDITTSEAVDYTVTKVEFVAHMVELSAAMQEAMDSAVAGNGLPMFFDTYYITSSTEQAAAGGSASASILSKTNWPIYKSAANVRSVYTCYVPRGSAAGAGYSASQDAERRQNSFEFIKPAATDWQYRLGTVQYPDFRVDSDAIGYHLAMDALPRDKLIGKSEPSVPLDRYTYSDFLSFRGNMLSMRDFVPGKGMLYIEEKNLPSGDGVMANIQVRESGVTAFLQGVSLESTPGVALSGQSTNIGNALSLESHYNETPEGIAGETLYPTRTLTQVSGVVGGDDGRLALLEVFHVMRYSRLLLVQANRNVVVKE